MIDVETHVRQVWNPDVRPLVDEAWRCYNAGAARPCIAATWTAIVSDIISKIIRLADDGDAQAIPFGEEVFKVQTKGLDTEGVRAMQRIESTLLDKAVEFELIDTIGARELGRIREDRNLCVHPALRAYGDAYEPRPEVARSHLAVALTTLLIHPPTQGRKAVDEFATYICDPRFVPAAAHIQATFFDRVRSATRRQVVVVAAKHALLELDPDGRLPAAEHADRMAVALSAFANRGRELVRTSMEQLGERFQKLDGDAQIRALVRLGEEDYFWSIVDPPLAGRLDDILGASLAVAELEPLPAGAASGAALVRSPYAREHLPALEARFTSLPTGHKLAVASANPDRYFLPAVLSIIGEAGSYRSGERAGRLLVQHAAFLTVDALRQALDNWCENTQCRRAAEMPILAVSLFHGTAHLGPARADAFGKFLTDVRVVEGDDEYYSYPGLETAMLNAGYL